MNRRAGSVAGLAVAVVVASLAIAMVADLGTASPFVAPGTWMASAGCVVVGGLSLDGASRLVARSLLAAAAGFVLVSAASATMVALMPDATPGAFVPGFAAVALMAPAPVAFVLPGRGPAVAAGAALAALVHVALMLGFERLQFGPRASLIDAHGWLIALVPAGWLLGTVLVLARRRRAAGRRDQNSSVRGNRG